MARQSGYSKYSEGVQRLLHDLWVELLSIVHALKEVTSQHTASDARMLPENTKKLNVAPQNIYDKVMPVWRRKLFSVCSPNNTL